MSKAMRAVLLIASAVMYDPPQALGLLGPQAQMLGYELKSAFDINRVLPQFARAVRR
jgi:hypothetical protein